ncbi:MAG: NAD-dependent epimerase/dehydratase family protein [Pseudomonadota bacterium]
MAKPRTLIAGMGRLGEAAASDLLAAGHEVIGINRRGTCELSKVRMLALDLTQPIQEALPAIDNVVIALAPGARDPETYRETYLGGVTHLLTGLAPASGRLLYVSSTVVYPQDDGGWIDEKSPVAAHNARAEVQLAAEAMVREAGARFAAGAVWLRLGGIYGPDRLGLLRRVRSGEPLPAAATAYSNRISQHDAARLVVHLLDPKLAAGCYLGVDQEPALMEDVVGWLARELGVPEPGLSDAAPRGKRISSQRVQASGFRFTYPTYREGYRELLPLLA